LNARAKTILILSKNPYNKVYKVRAESFHNRLKKGFTWKV